MAADRQRAAPPCLNKADNALPQAYYDELFKRRVVAVRARDPDVPETSDKCSLVKLAQGDLGP
jgi:hypothetical protein